MQLFIMFDVSLTFIEDVHVFERLNNVLENGMLFYNLAVNDVCSKIITLALLTLVAGQGTQFTPTNAAWIFSGSGLAVTS